MSSGEYGNAAKYFSMASEYAEENPQGVSDNAQQLAFFSGVAGVQAEEYEHAEKILGKLKDQGYEQNGDIYVYIATAQGTSSAIKRLQRDLPGRYKQIRQQHYPCSHSSSLSHIVNGEDPSIVLPTCSPHRRPTQAISACFWPKV